MDKIKVDLLVYGNIISETPPKLPHGSHTALVPADLLEEHYDISEAIVVEGDMQVHGFDAKNRVVVIVTN